MVPAATITDVVFFGSVARVQLFIKVAKEGNNVEEEPHIPSASEVGVRDDDPRSS